MRACVRVLFFLSEKLVYIVGVVLDHCPASNTRSTTIQYMLTYTIHADTLRHPSITGVDAVLMWVGFHAKKNAPRCGVVLSEPKGMNDGCLRPAGDPGPYDRYFKCQMKYGLMTSPANVTILEQVAHPTVTPGMGGMSEPATPTAAASPEKELSFEDMMNLAMAIDDENNDGEGGGGGAPNTPSQLVQRLGLAGLDDLKQYVREGHRHLVTGSRTSN